jgi:hypothetical protein
LLPPVAFFVCGAGLTGECASPCIPADLVQAAEGNLKGGGLTWHMGIEDGVDSDACLHAVGGVAWIFNERRLFTWFEKHGSSVVMSVIENVAISVSTLKINVHKLIILDNVHRLFSLYD